MAQHDYDLANQNGAAFRADLNAALAAIQSVNSGATEPAATVAYMPWADTNAGLWKVRNAADSAWVSVMSLTASRVDTAAGTSYDNSSSGLAATNVKDAIDEIVTTAAFEKATTDQAEAGTNDTAFMTPLKVNLVRKFVGEVFYIDTSKTGVEIPSNDGLARYIQLTAGLDGVGEFNEGLLTNESISGTAPLVVATAEIADAQSPMFGETVELLNTENRYEMPSEVAGIKANDVMQQITGSSATNFRSRSAQALPVGDGAISLSNREANDSGSGQSASYQLDFDSANSPNARTANHTNVKHKTVTAYMRIR